MIAVDRVVGGFKVSVFGIEAFFIRNRDDRADNRVINLNHSETFFPSISEDLKLYREALEISGMQWTDNVYKQLRVLSFLQLVREGVKRNPSGSFLELGVWKGLSAFMIGKVIRDEFGSTQKIILVDSFEGGLSDKSAHDANLVYDQNTQEILAEKMQFSSSRSETQSVMVAFDNVEIIEGWVPDVLEQIDKTEDFAFIHFDMDLYEPTIGSLEALWDRVQSRGILVFDDYNSTQFPGVTRAVEDFVEIREDEIDLFYEVPFGSSWIIKK